MFFKKKKDDLEKIEQQEAKKAEKQLDTNLDSALDDFDFPDEGLFSESKPKKRKPIADFAIGIVEAYKPKSLTIATAQALERKFPFGIGGVISDVSAAIYGVRSIKEALKEQLGPVVKAYKVAGRKLLRVFGAPLPEFIKKRLEKVFAEKPTPKAQSIEEQRQAFIQQQIQAVFKAQQQQLEAQQAQQESQFVLSQKLEDLRHEESVSFLARIANATRSTSIFLTSTFRAYLMKSLELKYKSVFIMQDMLAYLKMISSILETKLEAIKYNTSLPEVVKISTSDLWTKIKHEKLQGFVSRKLSDWTRNFVRVLTEKAKKSIIDQISMYTSMAEMGAQAAEMYADMAEMMPSESSAARSGGGVIGAFIRGRLINKLLDYINKKSGGRLEDINTILQTGRSGLLFKLMDLAEQGKAEEAPWYAKGLAKLRELGILPYSLEEKFTLKRNLEYTGTEPVPFDVITRKSIIEIIPGYLAKILSNVEAIREAFDVKPKEEIIYDVTKETFVTKSEIKKRLEQQYFGSKEENTKKIQSLVEKLIKDYEEAGGSTTTINETFDSLIKFFTNLTVYNKTPNMRIMVKLANGEDLTEGEKRYVEKAFKGIPEDQISTIAQIFTKAYHITEEPTTEEEGLGIEEEKEGLEGIKAKITSKAKEVKERAKELIPRRRKLAELEKELIQSFVSKEYEQERVMKLLTEFGYKDLFKEYFGGLSEEELKAKEQELKTEFKKKYGKDFEKNPAYKAEFESILERYKKESYSISPELFKKKLLETVSAEDIKKSVLGLEEPTVTPQPSETITPSEPKPIFANLSDTISSLISTFKEGYNATTSLLTDIKEKIIEFKDKVLEKSDTFQKNLFSQLKVITKWLVTLDTNIRSKLDEKFDSLLEAIKELKPAPIDTKGLMKKRINLFSASGKVLKTIEIEVDKAESSAEKDIFGDLENIKDIPHISGPGIYAQLTPAELHLPLDPKEGMKTLVEAFSLGVQKGIAKSKTLSSYFKSSLESLRSLLETLSSKFTELQESLGFIFGRTKDTIIEKVLTFKDDKKRKEVLEVLERKLLEKVFKNNKKRDELLENLSKQTKSLKDTLYKNITSRTPSLTKGLEQLKELKHKPTKPKVKEEIIAYKDKLLEGLKVKEKTKATKDTLTKKFTDLEQKLLSKFEKLKPSKEPKKTLPDSLEPLQEQLTEIRKLQEEILKELKVINKGNKLGKTLEELEEPKTLKDKILKPILTVKDKVLDVVKGLPSKVLKTVTWDVPKTLASLYAKYTKFMFSNMYKLGKGIASFAIGKVLPTAYNAVAKTVKTVVPLGLKGMEKLFNFYKTSIAKTFKLMYNITPKLLSFTAKTTKALASLSFKGLKTILPKGIDFGKTVLGWYGKGAKMIGKITLGAIKGATKPILSKIPGLDKLVKESPATAAAVAGSKEISSKMDTIIGLMQNIQLAPIEAKLDVSIALLKGILETLRGKLIGSKQKQIRKGSYQDFLRDEKQAEKEKREKLLVQKLKEMVSLQQKELKLEKEELKQLKEIDKDIEESGEGKKGILDDIKDFLLSKLPIPKSLGKFLPGSLSKGIGLLGKVGGALGRIGGIIGRLGRFAGPIGLALTAGMGLLDAFKGWQHASEITGSEDLGLLQKIGAGLSSALSGLTFGLISSKTFYKGLSTLAKFSPLGLAYVGAKKLFNWLSPKEAVAAEIPITKETKDTDIDKLLAIQRQVESGGNPYAVSHAGAKGLAQFMPSTWKDIWSKKEFYAKYNPNLAKYKGIPDIFDPQAQIDAQKAYMNYLLEQFNGDKRWALAAYNWGIGNAKKLYKATGGDFEKAFSQLPKETQNYVTKIIGSLPEKEHEGSIFGKVFSHIKNIISPKEALAAETPLPVPVTPKLPKPATTTIEPEVIQPSPLSEKPTLIPSIKPIPTTQDPLSNLLTVNQKHLNIAQQQLNVLLSISSKLDQITNPEQQPIKGTTINASTPNLVGILQQLNEAINLLIQKLDNFNPSGSKLTSNNQSTSSNQQRNISIPIEQKSETMFNVFKRRPQFHRF